MNHDERIAADRERVVEAVRQRVASGSAIPASLTEVRAVLDALDEAMRESGRSPATGARARPSAYWRSTCTTPMETASMRSEVMVMVPGDVAAWVDDAAASMGVPKAVVWYALVEIARAADREDENALIDAVERAMDEASHDVPSESPLLSIAGVLSTVPIARSTLYRHISRGDLTPIRVGRRVFVHRAELARWLRVHVRDLSAASAA